MKTLKIGQFNPLKVKKTVSFGLYLDGLDQGNILLPLRYQPEKVKIGDILNVFVYLDSDDTLIATTQKPKAIVGQCAFLKVKQVNRIGAFLDWGLAKDLFVPFKQQNTRMKEGACYLVYVYLDNSGRIAASSKIDWFLDEQADRYLKTGQKVEIEVWQASDLGYKAVINNQYIGLLYKNEIFQQIRPGQKLSAFIKNIRKDKKIDLTLQGPKQNTIDDLMQNILSCLARNQGVCFLTDKSPPEAIYKQFSVSKSLYKKALGKLYKQRLISITPQKIELVNK